MTFSPSALVNLRVSFRCRLLQSCGSSAALALGAGSIADIYGPDQNRGSKLGVFYAVPLLGPSLAPLIGGAITEASDWRATFWFLLAVSFLPFVRISLGLVDNDLSRFRR